MRILVDECLPRSLVDELRRRQHDVLWVREVCRGYEDEQVLAYHHTRPFWPVHVVVVPKRHIASLTTVTEEDEDDVRALLQVVQRVAATVEEEHGAAAVLTNLGRYQDSRHLHVHVSSGSPLRG